jgi:hypothetical protein
VFQIEFPTSTEFFSLSHTLNQFQEFLEKEKPVADGASLTVTMSPVGASWLAVVGGAVLSPLCRV